MIKVPTAYLYGSTAHIVEASAAKAPGTSTEVLGMIGPQGKETRVRVRSVVESSLASLRNGNLLPHHDLTVEGVPGTRIDSGVDLALALALEAAVVGDLVIPEGWLFVAELALGGGNLRPVRGMLAIAEAALAAGYHTIVCATRNAREAALVPELCVLGVNQFDSVVDVLRDPELVQWYTCRAEPAPPVDDNFHAVDFADVYGHESVKNALAVAVLADCDVCLLGPPGCGKTMLAKRVSSLLEPMSRDEYLTVVRNFSAAGLIDGGLPLGRRPFRAPHHTISDVGMIGGGVGLHRPGEVSLAHAGVLMIDEVVEFKRSTLQLAQWAVRDGHATLHSHRDDIQVESTFPSRPAMIVYSDWSRAGTDGFHAEWHRRLVERVNPTRDRPVLFVEVPGQTHDQIREAERVSSVDLRKRMATARALMTATREWGRMTWAEDTTAPRRLGHTLKHGACSNREDWHRPWVRVAEALAAVSGSSRVEQSHIDQARAWLDGGFGCEATYDPLEPEQPIGADAFPPKP